MPTRQTLRVARSQSRSPSSLYSRSIRASDEPAAAAIRPRYSKPHAFAVTRPRAYGRPRRTISFVSIASDLEGKWPVLNRLVDDRQALGYARHTTKSRYEMRRTPAVGAAAPLLIAALAAGAAAVPCAPTGLARVAVEAAGLQVVEPHVADLQAGDVLVQLNGRPIRTCAELERALEEARDGGLAILLLVRRGETTRAVAVERWEDEPAPASPTSTAVVPTPMPTVAPPPAPPPAAPPRASARVESDAARQSAADALRFGHKLRAALPLGGSKPWTSELESILRAHERRRATDAKAAAVDPSVSYYSAALESAAYKRAEMREAHSAVGRAGAILEYSSSSPVAAWLERFPFVGEAVVETPKKLTFIAKGERPGSWMPDRAVELLVERAIAESEALAAGRSGSVNRPS